MQRKIFKPLLVLATTSLLLSGCKKWEDHNAITDPATTRDLFTQISENTNLSKFTELLTKTGYDKVIASSKTFTVFAPTNAALAALDPAVINDASKLRLFVANHIANQIYKTTAVTVPLRLKMLSDKYNNLLGKKLEDANITEADHYGKNGVFHIIDKIVPALPNAWEFLESSPLAPGKQKEYLLSLYRNVFDTTNAVQIGVDPITGKPIYQPGTDSVKTNLFWRNVYDLRDESKQYTFFVMRNDGWDAEVGKYKPFYVTGTDDSTTNLARWAVARDLAVEGVYDAATIPDTILSKFRIKVGINKTAIVQTIKTSNGVVFIMDAVTVRPVDKFPSFVIQGENYQTSSHDRRGNTYFREKYNPLTGFDFRDVLVYKHGVALFNLGYRLTGMPSLKYRAYWVAVHDNINGITASFDQKLGIGTATSTILPYIKVNPNNYSEVYLGEFPLATYMPTLMIYLTAANSTAETANPIVCDYIRFEPVF
jgi:uncharacterized surface protein with fasciclin (FAS1) repeats